MSAVAKPVDRLAPDELAAGNALVWGFAVPRDMQIEHQYVQEAAMIGPVQPDALANYVRDCVVVSHGGPLKILASMIAGMPIDMLTPAPAMGSVMQLTL